MSDPRNTFLTILTGIVLASIAAIVLPISRGVVSSQATLDEQELATWEQRLTIIFEGEDWQQALRMVADQLKLPLVIPTEVFESEDRSSRLLLQASYVDSPAGIILKEILGPQDLHWHLIHGRITIGEGYDRRHVRRNYELKRFVSRGWTLQIESTDERPPGDKDDGGFISDVPLYCCHRQPTLTEMIYEFTDTDWKGSTGIGGSIEVHGKSLSILHTLNTHCQIRRMFALFDEMANGRFAKSGVECFVEPGDAIVLVALSKPVTVHCEDVSLQQALQLLEEASGVPVRIDPDDPDEAWIPNDTVSLTVTNVSLAEALAKLCSPLDLTYYIYLGQCRIAGLVSWPVAYSPRHVRWFYDIADLDAEVRKGIVERLYQETDLDWICQTGIGGWAARLPGDILFVRHTDKAQLEIQRILQETRRHST